MINVDVKPIFLALATALHSSYFQRNSVTEGGNTELRVLLKSYTFIISTKWKDKNTLWRFRISTGATQCWIWGDFYFLRLSVWHLPCTIFGVTLLYFLRKLYDSEYSLLPIGFIRAGFMLERQFISGQPLLTFYVLGEISFSPRWGVKGMKANWIHNSCSVYKINIYILNTQKKAIFG